MFEVWLIFYIDIDTDTDTDTVTVTVTVTVATDALKLQPTSHSDSEIQIVSHLAWQQYAWLRASDDTTPLKLFLVMECNRPVRNLLFYILRYEQEAQIQIPSFRLWI